MRPADLSNITVGGWLERVEAKRAVAYKMVDDRKNCREAWQAAGTAVEFMIKAVIMRRTGFNRWPDRASRPDLYIHDLGALLRTAGIERDAVPAALRGRIKTVLDWDRAHDYAPGRMSRRQARTMVDAAFAADGVIAWLMTL